MGKLSGKVILITGGARGQGRSHAVTLAGEGADIVVCDIAEQLPTVPYPLASEEDLEETRRLVESKGRKCLSLKADIRDRSELEMAVGRTIQEFGRIDGLIANAGIFSGGVPAWELTEAQWDEVLAVNLKGVWLSCKYVIPHMLSRSSGGIVLISSMAGLEGYHNCAHYVASKHGVIGLMRALANELGPHGIRVNAVCPTTVRTESVLNQFMYNLFAGGEGGTLADLTEGMRDINLLPTELIDPQDVSNAVLWLLSDLARHVTGLVLTVDAGANVKFGP
jgi:SDR family mycofactocin-dependent oxidoreductase